MKAQLSICIIAKNEEQNIARCLESLKPYEMEIVVVDTGSSDSTRDVALRYTENVYDFKWCDDFAVAKNFAISKATNEYVMVIDSDEYLEKIEIEKLQDMLEKNPDKVARIQRRNFFVRNQQENEYTEWINRIFLKEHFHYEGSIHEQVVAKNGKAYETYRAPVLILHSGYDLTEEERKEKAKRNIHLLLIELERLEQEKQTEQLPYILYQLGKSYYMAGDYLTACDYFSKGLTYDLNPQLEYVIDMVETYGYALLNSGQAEQALFFENIYNEFGNTADFQFLLGLIYMNNACFKEAVEEFLKATKHKECKAKGVNSYSSYYNIGVIYECLGNEELAREYYLKSGTYEPAIKRLKELDKN